MEKFSSECVGKKKKIYYKIYIILKSSLTKLVKFKEAYKNDIKKYYIVHNM